MKINEIDKSVYLILKEFVYWTIFNPLGVKLPERKIIYNSDKFIYIENVGNENLTQYNN